MGLLSRARLAVPFGILLSHGQYAGCQQQADFKAGFEKPVVLSLSDPQPSAVELSFSAVKGAMVGSLLGGGAGFVIDGEYCKRHRGDEQGFMFGPCAFYGGEASATGWFGGALIGATVGAAQVAQKGGCSRTSALWRSFAGAAIGVAPGLSIVAGRPGKYPPWRTAVILGTPLLSGIGAGLAVIGCSH